MDDKEMAFVIESASDVIDRMTERLKKAAELLRDWRDKYGGQEVYRVRNFGTLTGASPTDLLRDTQKWIEGK